MWELRQFTSYGGLFGRGILSFVLAAIVAAFLWIIATPQNSLAVDATWNNGSLTYENNSYTGPVDDATVEALDLPEETTVYTYTEPASQADRKIHALYFAPTIDALTASQANYRTYTYVGANNFTNPSSASAVTLTGATAGTANDDTSSCAVDGGLGWVICPITITFAGWMDGIYEALANFLKVRPLELGQDNAMYTAWSYMRAFANVAFVIAFLIIIYSQLTNVGINNYSIKKLLPRLIIAAVLVNLSYIICATAIDLSNVLGYGVQDLFITMRDGLVGPEGNSWELLSFESVASFVLAGGIATAAVGTAGILAAVTYGPAAVALLLPTLVGGILALLVALLIVAGRQAIITVLTIIAPLAFVAYLLPNTEKWFEKWRSLFMTMLIFFPAFSLVFGGSQFASAIIIQNAEDINVVILALAVQLAPLYLTPLLLKLSGNLLTRIAGIVNNPNKGLIDRTRNFANDRADVAKARRLGTPAKSWEVGKRAAQRLDNSRRKREGWKSAYGAMADASWANSQAYSDIDQANRQAGEEKQLGETLSEKRYNVSKVTNATIQQLDIDVREVKLNTENAKLNADVKNWEENHSVSITRSKILEKTLKGAVEKAHATHQAEFDEFKNGGSIVSAGLPLDAQSVAMQRQAMENGRVLALNGMRNESAKRVQNKKILSMLEENTELIDGLRPQEYAAGIDIDGGRERVLAAAVSAQSKAYNESLANAQAILASKNFSDDEKVDLSLGNTVKGIAPTKEMKEAAADMITKGQNTTAIKQFMESVNVDTTEDTQDMRQIIFDNLSKNGKKPVHLPIAELNKYRDGTVSSSLGVNRTDDQVVAAVNGNKYGSARGLVTMDKEYLKNLSDALARKPRGDFASDNLETLKSQLETAFKDNDYFGEIGDREAALRSIAGQIGADITR